MKSRRRKNTRRRSRQSRKRLRGGGCGCGHAQPLLGGSAHLDALPLRYYYNLNNEVNNPNYLKGGKKRRIRGGMSSFLTNLPTIGSVGGLGYSDINSSLVQPSMINETKQYFA